MMKQVTMWKLTINDCYLTLNLTQLAQSYNVSRGLRRKINTLTVDNAL